MKKKKVALVTGSEGFIGSHLIKYLYNKNYLVVATHYKKLSLKVSGKIKYLKCDVRNRKKFSLILKKYKPDEVYHLAAKSFPSFSFKYPIQTMKTNIFGTLNILEEIRHLKLDTKILIACSSGQYGSRHLKNLPLKEKYVFRPQHLYGLSKVFQNLMGFQYFKMYNLKVYNAIIFNTTGPGKKGDVFSDFCKQYINNKIINNKKTISVGNLNKYRDFLHVQDLVKGLHRIIEAGKPGEDYNLCSSKLHKVSKIIDLMRKNSKHKVNIKENFKLKRNFDEKYIFGSNAKIKKIGWKPILKIENIFHDICKHYETIKKNNYNLYSNKK